MRPQETREELLADITPECSFIGDSRVACCRRSYWAGSAAAPSLWRDARVCPKRGLRLTARKWELKHFGPDRSSCPTTARSTLVHAGSTVSDVPSQKIRGGFQGSLHGRNGRGGDWAKARVLPSRDFVQALTTAVPGRWATPLPHSRLERLNASKHPEQCASHPSQTREGHGEDPVALSGHRSRMTDQSYRFDP